MKLFFQVTGVLIILFAAGLMSRGVLFLQSSGDLGTLNDGVYNLTGQRWLTQVDPDRPLPGRHLRLGPAAVDRAGRGLPGVPHPGADPVLQEAPASSAGARQRTLDHATV